ncbi:MAG TPA: hypothetical protein VK912_17975 [Longimicrobiales bacterium]|nr:hypothetical protein [Longimicrobiales bacterium]
MQRYCDIVEIAALRRAALPVELDAAAVQLGRGNETAPAGRLGTFINQLHALDGSGRLDRETAGPLANQAQRIIDALD